MLAHTTVLLPMTNDTSRPLILSPELALTIVLIFRRVLFPCIGVLGISGNVTSIVMVTRQGFRKCSNILLLSLSLSNICFLFGINNIPDQIYASNHPAGFQFSEAINYLCYILYIICEYAYKMGLIFGPLIPVLITGERILVIVCPFKAYRILTPRRTMMTLLCFYLVTGMYCLYHEILTLQLKTFVIKGVTTAMIVNSEMWRTHVSSGLFQLLEHTFNYTTGIVPLCLIPVGCVIIGFKIIHIKKRRQQLTYIQIKDSSKHGTTKTTKTLLKICLLYVLCYGFGFAVLHIVESKPLEQEGPLKVVILNIQMLVNCLNSLGDFLIYFAANKRFWKSITEVRKNET